MTGTILLADDSITIQKVVELTFAGTDSEVIAVGSGRELLEKLPEVRPQVVLCDVVMPDMNGYDVCQQIKSDPATLHIPVVLLTGTFEPFDRERAIAAGCDNIVTKPFEAKELVGIVEELLERAAAAEASEANEMPPAMPSQADQIPEEGLDFTTTGFEKMVPPEEQPIEAPSHGLDVTGSFREEFAEPPARKSDADTQPVMPVFGEQEPPAPSVQGTGPFAQEASAGESEWASAEPGEGAGRPSETSLEDREGNNETVRVGAAHFTAGTEAAIGAVEDPGGATPEHFGARPVGGPAGWSEDAQASAVVPEAAPGGGASAVTEPAGASVAGPLSDEDVERIARRVVELAAPQLERIAWDVIPDMAEMLVRKRIRELEAAVEEEN